MKMVLTTIHVSDFEKSLAFYTEKIGLPLIRRFDSPNGPIAMLGDPESAHLELIGDGKGPVDIPLSIGFLAEDPEAVAKDIAGDDYIGPIHAGPEVVFCFVRDPDGYVVQLTNHA